MMTMKDIDALNRAHDSAVQEMNRCAVTIAESVLEKKSTTAKDVNAYKVARLGVESTRRDLENCISNELDELLGGVR